jgi:predicted 3-demethylubiquinone-9 3-methyltransferase (glyoxalase superfamily)
MDAKVGGSHKMSFTNFTTGKSHSFGGTYVETSKDVDYFWEKRSAGGEKGGRCGWLTDKFGLSWQVVPAVLVRMMHEDTEKSQRVMQAVLQMDKIDIADLKRAYDG